MKFSVIIPSYGQAKYLEGAIRSALSQTHQDLEVIVIDDGSTDGSLEIAERYINHPKVKLVRQTNKGLASARNAGIMRSIGDYVLPLDADDELLPEAVATLAGYASGDRYDVIAPSIRCVDEQGNTQDTILMQNPSFEDFAQGNRLPYCCAIKLRPLLEVGGYSPKMDVLGGWEDLHLWYALMAKGNVIKTIQTPLVTYRVKAKSMWKDIEADPAKKQALWAQIVKDFPETKSHVKA